MTGACVVWLCPPGSRVVALGEVEERPHPAQPGPAEQCSWPAISETCLSVRVGRPPLLRWVGILGSVVWLGGLLPPFGWHEGGCADHRVRVDRRDLIGAWHRPD
jgi:hypothetical protein